MFKSELITKLLLSTIIVLLISNVFVSYQTMMGLTELSNSIKTQPATASSSTSSATDESVSDFLPTSLAFCDRSSRKKNLSLGSLKLNTAAQLTNGTIVLTKGGGVGAPSLVLSGNFLVEVRLAAPANFSGSTWGTLALRLAEMGTNTPSEVIAARNVFDNQGYSFDTLVSGSAWANPIDSNNNLVVTDQNRIQVLYVGRKDGMLYTGAEVSGKPSELLYSIESKIKKDYAFSLSIDGSTTASATITGITVYQCGF